MLKAAFIEYKKDPLKYLSLSAVLIISLAICLLIDFFLPFSILLTPLILFFPVLFFVQYKISFSPHDEEEKYKRSFMMSWTLFFKAPWNGLYRFWINILKTILSFALVGFAVFFIYFAINRSTMEPILQEAQNLASIGDFEAMNNLFTEQRILYDGQNLTLNIASFVATSIALYSFSARLYAFFFRMETPIRGSRYANILYRNFVNENKKTFYKDLFSYVYIFFIFALIGHGVGFILGKQFYFGVNKALTISLAITFLLTALFLPFVLLGVKNQDSRYKPILRKFLLNEIKRSLDEYIEMRKPGPDELAMLKKNYEQSVEAINKLTDEKFDIFEQ